MLKVSSYMSKNTEKQHVNIDVISPTCILVPQLFHFVAVPLKGKRPKLQPESIHVHLPHPVLRVDVLEVANFMYKRRSEPFQVQ